MIDKRAQHDAGSEIVLSVVIPAYNEETRLPRTLSETTRFLDRQAYASEVIVVDDGSHDRTSSVVEGHRGQFTRLRLLRLPRNVGKGGAVRAGVQRARGRTILVSDADLSTPTSEIDGMLRPLFGNRCDVVLGSRTLAAMKVRRSRLRQMLSAQFQRVRRLLLPLGIEDTQCGFKAFRTEVARSIFARQTLDGFAFDCEVLLIARRQGWRLLERPVRWEERSGSTVSFVAVLRMAVDLLRICVQDLAGRYGEVRGGSRAHAIDPRERQGSCSLPIRHW